MKTVCRSSAGPLLFSVPGPRPHPVPKDEHLFCQYPGHTFIWATFTSLLENLLGLLRGSVQLRELKRQVQ